LNNARTSPPSSSLDAQKTGIRGKARAIRAAIAEDARRDAAHRVAAAGLGFLAMPPGIVAGYFPVRSEFDCLPLLARLSADGWSLALPVVREGAPLEFRAWAIGAPLVPGPRGIMQPPDATPVVPRVLVVPLLAFDARGFRLGYGGGHYDRTLQAMRAGSEVTAIGIAFDEQEMPEIPVNAHDEPLDWILTPFGPHAMQGR
jgi:5-formyltetrahydrofolate cyclo-ligase